MIKQIFTKIRVSITRFLEVELVAMCLYLGFISTIKFMNLIDVFHPLIRLLIALFAFLIILFLYARFRDFLVDYFEHQMAATTASRLGIVIRVSMILLLLLSSWLCWMFAPILFTLLFTLPFLPILIEKDEESSSHSSSRNSYDDEGFGGNNFGENRYNQNSYH
ncbi:hypothetical protein K5X82_07955 [Halosquirtibacter xylanolyticus]|uniref:hypothetical protein n=1 Tax=Halosquirtibacter xylanolyticus TaxID=3374599 RepID=UPI003748B4FC|nr:hypothetical protein K5X82_07955 [Prolixibacteraceae bacterium]